MYAILIFNRLSQIKYITNLKAFICNNLKWKELFSDSTLLGYFLKVEKIHHHAMIQTNSGKFRIMTIEQEFIQLQ